MAITAFLGLMIIFFLSVKGSSEIRKKKMNNQFIYFKPKSLFISSSSRINKIGEGYQRHSYRRYLYQRKAM